MKSRTVRSSWDAYTLLPEQTKKAARKNFLLWSESPFHPSLHFKCVNQEERIWSVRVTQGYRALGILDADTVTWFWIGGHQEYQRLF